jgi:hypothetical protein
VNTHPSPSAPGPSESGLVHASDLDTPPPSLHSELQPAPQHVESYEKNRTDQYSNSSDSESTLCDDADWEEGLKALQKGKQLELPQITDNIQNIVIEDEASSAEDDSDDDETNEARRLLQENSDSEEDEDGEAQPNLVLLVEKNIRELERMHNPTRSVVKSLKQLIAVKEYEELRLRFVRHGRSRKPALNASLAIARSFGKGPYFARQIRSNAKYLLKYHHLPPTKQQQGHGQVSLLDDERVLHGVRMYLAAKKLGEITPRDLCDHVNTVICPALGVTGPTSSICEHTAINWLHKLGYKYSSAKKGVYVDGHQRPDVQAALTTFLSVMEELQS